MQIVLTPAICSFSMIDIVFLGTSCMKPTKERNQTSVFLSYKNEGIMFDCGEGAQRQLRLFGRRREKTKKKKIFSWRAGGAFFGVFWSWPGSGCNIKKFFFFFFVPSPFTSLSCIC